MKRFLLVGCGGSGGATVQFLIDQLRAELASLPQQPPLPKGWQFVHVDVPAASDQVRPGMPPVVQAHATGAYVRVSAPGATYPHIATTVEGKLAGRDALGELASWRPQPDRVNVPIEDGAGQYRAVGRMLALSRLAQLREELTTAWERLQPQDVIDELNVLEESVSGSPSDQAASPPMVFVVSSMAGGTGASTVLDVCRLLAGIPNLDPSRIALFLFTAEVFSDLPEHLRLGVEANAAAMLAELIATQAGAASDSDRRLFSALGIADVAAQVPFRRVIPIGSRIGGDGARFGDGTHDGVYRGLGRGLAALMMSGVATDNLQKTVVENHGAPAATRRDRFGWGIDADALSWGAFGYASVGLGRDRYAEYAAQRIARRAVDRLVTGHMQPGVALPASTQIDRLIEGSLWRQLVTSAKLPGEALSVSAWFGGLLRTVGLSPAVDGVVKDTVAPLLDFPSPRDLRDVLPALSRRAAEARPLVEERVAGATEQWAFAWFEQYRRDVVATTSATVEAYGLPAARAQLDRLSTAVTEWSAELERAASPVDVSSLPPSVMHEAGAIRGNVGASHPILAKLRMVYGRGVEQAFSARLALALGRLLAASVPGLITPLRAACGDMLRELEAARAAQATAIGQARLQTDDYSAWPQPEESTVAARFLEAHNQVLLSSAEDFPARFRAHVTEMIQSPFDAALGEIVTEVLRGRWKTAGGRDEDRPMFTAVAEWWPNMFPHNPRDAQRRPVPERSARYRMLLAPSSVLARARDYVARPGEMFATFVGQSLHDYLVDDTASPVELRDRSAAVRRSFGQALKLARPLVAVNRQTISTVHAESVQYHFTFSAAPFNGLDLAGDVVRDLRNDGEITPETLDAFAEALRSGDGSRVTGVNIFGSYKNLSPVVFRSLLAPIANRWAQCDGGARHDFWRWRRTRRLPGAIPASPADRRAMIAGWFIGRMTGLLRFPGEEHSRTIAIYDVENAEWVSLPHPLVTPPEKILHSLDQLPAVLESLPLAVAQCHAAPDLAPLRPYALMRGLFDNGDDGPSPGTPGLSESTAYEYWGRTQPEIAGARHLGHWIRTGTSPSGLLPPARQAGSADAKPAERQEALAAAYAQIRDAIGRDFLLPGDCGAAGGGRYSQITSPSQLIGVPPFHEIAVDAYEMLGVLHGIVADLPLDSEAPPASPYSGF